MKDEISTDPPVIKFAEKFWLFLLLVFVFLTRIYFFDVGFGRPDAWRVGVTGKLLVLTGTYVPSRPPGFPLTELIAALGFAIFRGSNATWIFTNTLTCLVFCVSVAGVWALARKWSAPFPFALATVYAFAPLNWVYSVETIDYLWLTSFLVLSVLAIESGQKPRPIPAGILFGLATSARFFAGFQLIPLLILILTRQGTIKDAIKFFVSFAIVTLGFYSLVFSHVKSWSEYVDWFHELNRVASALAKIEGGTLAKRFLIPGSGLFGPFASIGFVIACLIGLPNFIRKIHTRDRGTVASSLLILFIIVPYLWHLHPNYMIPATGFFLILLACSVDLKIFMLVGALIIAANFPLWQANVEGLKAIDPGMSNPKIKAYAQALAPYQNETVFNETRVRSMIFGSVTQFLENPLSENWVIMANLRLPTIQFLIPDIREIDLPLSDGGSINVWTSGSGGAKFRYMMSPNQTERIINSGYHAIYLPGMESTYYATYGVPINEVKGVEVLYENSEGNEINTQTE